MEMDTGNQALDHSKVPSQTIERSINMRRFFSITFGVTVLLVVIVVGAYYLNARQNKDAASRLNANQSANNHLDLNIAPTNTPEPSSSVAIPGWESYVNIVNNYSIQYPPSFEIVKGSVPEAEMSTLDSVTFSGLSKENDLDAGVVFGISINPTDANGELIRCTTNDDCLNQWLGVLQKRPDEISKINTSIMGKSIAGFEYQSENSLYTQTNQYFIYSDRGKVWNVWVTMNNYDPKEVAGTIDQILSTFKYLN